MVFPKIYREWKISAHDLVACKRAMGDSYAQDYPPQKKLIEYNFLFYTTSCCVSVRLQLEDLLHDFFKYKLNQVKFVPRSRIMKTYQIAMISVN